MLILLLVVRTPSDAELARLQASESQGQEANGDNYTPDSRVDTHSRSSYWAL